MQWIPSQVRTSLLDIIDRNENCYNPCSDEQLQHIEKRMIMEINWGLGRDTNLSSNIKSYITYVSSLPSGREEGEYLALDLGGTNFRSAECYHCLALPWKPALLNAQWITDNDS